jgi:hypothetical protein
MRMSGKAKTRKPIVRFLRLLDTNQSLISSLVLVAAALLMVDGARALTTCQVVKETYGNSIARCGPGIPVPPPDVMGVSARADYELCKDVLKGIDQILLQACPDNAHGRSRKHKGQETVRDPRLQAAPAGTSSKNNLDKFDLGPSYASPSTVNTGAGARSSGAKGTKSSQDGVAPDKYSNPTLFKATKP